jgi:surface polysaccharide O-acyltransferase-like enzyme
MTKPTTPYFIWADIVRVVSIFLVVLLHTAASLVYQWGKVPDSWWWAANLYDSFSRMSVPLFVMLSGALLLPKTEKYEVFFHKRIKRVLIPWIVWASIHVLWQIFWGGLHTTSFAVFKAFYIQTFLGGFWFLVMLIGVYLLTPLWRLFIQKASRVDYMYFFTLWFLLASFFPLVGKLSHHYYLPALPLSLQYSGYFVLGYFLTKVKISHIYQKGLVATGVVMSLCIAIATSMLSMSQHQFGDTFYDFLHPFQVVCATSFFLFFTSLHIKNDKSFLTTHGGVIKKLSQSTLGIFLLHTIWLDVFQKYFFYDQFLVWLHPALAIPLVTILIYVLSFLIIGVLRISRLGRLVT